jgi:hypothetical protein
VSESVPTGGSCGGIVLLGWMLPCIPMCLRSLRDSLACALNKDWRMGMLCMRLIQLISVCFRHSIYLNFANTK